MAINVALSELIEWAVSVDSTKETGKTYVAPHGAVWGAHRDILLAAVGATITMLVTYMLHRRKKNKENKPQLTSAEL